MYRTTDQHVCEPHSLQELASLVRGHGVLKHGMHTLKSYPNQPKVIYGSVHVPPLAQYIEDFQPGTARTVKFYGWDKDIGKVACRYYFHEDGGVSYWAKEDYELTCGKDEQYSKPCPPATDFADELDCTTYSLRCQHGDWNVKENVLYFRISVWCKKNLPHKFAQEVTKLSIFTPPVNCLWEVHNASKIH